jgi:hypothetical protein
MKELPATIPMEMLIGNNALAPSTPTSSLVGFFDILGTKAAVRKGQFDDYCAFDFANPVGLAARKYPFARFAVFSDSAIISCDSTQNDSAFCQ